VSCGHLTRIKDPEPSAVGEAPAFETVWGFGSDCGIDDLDSIIKANYLCDEYGIDAISMGGTIACAMELFERGYLTAEDTDGIQLTFGNAEAMVEMVRRAGLGIGFGAQLAEGSYRLAESCGHPELSMTVKKQEIPACDPRGLQGLGLSYATDNVVGRRVRGYAVAAEASGDESMWNARVTEAGIASDVVFQNVTAALDSSGACVFSTYGLGGEALGEMLSALTGVTYTLADFMQAGERIWNNERLWNVRNGYTAADDTLPERLLTEPVTIGSSEGEVSRLNEMLPEYYGLRGWDRSGVPSAAKLEELAL
jgi:aldehyde:ferredoxin oxidoreductase